MARMMSRFLTGEGFDVRTASSMVDASDLMAREAFDLLISDLNLPDGNGLDLMKRACANRPIRGIALSGSNTPEDIAKCNAAGFSAHLTKPVELDRLLATIAEVGMRATG